MELVEQCRRANALRELHAGPQPLILLNAWDVASALHVATCFPAVATSSGGVAFARGYPDGEVIPLPEVLGFVSRLTAFVPVPVSVDFESGYGATSADVEASCRQLFEAGAVGLNLEDCIAGGPKVLAPADVAAERVAAAVRAANSAGIPAFINARTDSYWLKLGTPEERFSETVRRACLYRDAGADGIFVPGLADIEVIRALVQAVPLPLNVMWGPGSPSIAELEAAGVRRISVGGSAMMGSMQLFERVARKVAEARSFDVFAQAA